MKRYMMLLVITICQLAVNVYAGEFFERGGLAIDGYDPVAYFTDQKPVKGSAQFHSDFQGSTFQFMSAAHRDAFALNPVKFAPQYGGYCAYGMAKGYKATIDPAAFTVVGEKLYLNYSETIHSRWLSAIPGYVQKADTNWPEVQKQGKVHE
jgi:YHS domain-containing protein